MDDLERVGRVPSVAFLAPRAGLPCRSPRCVVVFARSGMASSVRVLLDVAVERDQHERDEHGLVVERPHAPQLRFGDGVIQHRGRRARIGRNLP